MERPFALIPLPEVITPVEGAFPITQNTTISADSPNMRNVVWLQQIFLDLIGFAPEIVDRAGDIQLIIDQDDTELGQEGYFLSILPEGIQIRAAAAAGIFYGIQTLGQMLPVRTEGQGDGQIELPNLVIKDQPRYAWRGFMLDEGRHFHGIKTVKQLLDVMAVLKMNIFHWHLTEDQGWRIEIKKYPRLTEIGAQRPGTAKSMLQGLWNGHDGVSHQGYYTQDQIREIAAYAAERHITVVPEIEMPGHSAAALAAYPEFSCRGAPQSVRTSFGISRDVYCVGNEATFDFLEDILNEILAIFPGKYIHLGGDETPLARWKQCPRCQQRMADEGLPDEGGLHRYMIERISRFLFQRGREVVGWNENLHDGLHPDFIIQYWIRGEQEMAEAVRNGRRVILSPYLDYYLDHSYWLTPLSRTYAYQPGFRTLTQSEAGSILGIEAPLWTEFVPGLERLSYQVFPRLLAVAETGWTSEHRKDYEDFSARYRRFKHRIRRWGFTSAPDKDVEPCWLKRVFGLFTIAQKQTKTANN